MYRGTRSTSLQVLVIIRPVGRRYKNHKFSSGPFWTHKIKAKDKNISISNILHLLSAPASIPSVGAVLACLVVKSRSNCKFIIISNLCLIVDSCFHPSTALKGSLEAFTPSTWTYFCYFLFSPFPSVFLLSNCNCYFCSLSLFLYSCYLPFLGVWVVGLFQLSYFGIKCHYLFLFSR